MRKGPRWPMSVNTSCPAPEMALSRAPAPPWAPQGSPGDSSDVKARPAPGVHESQQPPLEVRETGHVALHKARLVLEEQWGTHLQESTPSGCGPAGTRNLCPRHQDPRRTSSLEKGLARRQTWGRGPTPGGPSTSVGPHRHPVLWSQPGTHKRTHAGLAPGGSATIPNSIMKERGPQEARGSWRSAGLSS